MKKIIKIVAVILVLSMFVQMVPLNALNNPSNTTETAQATDNATLENSEETGKTEPEILSECVDMRTADTKYFRCSGGSYIAARYSTPVHFNDSGVWRDIDNSLISSSTDDSEYRTNISANEIAIPKKLERNKWISISKNKYTVKLGIDNGENAESFAQIKSNIKNTPKNNIDTKTETAVTKNNNEKMSLSKLSSSVTYPDAFASADLNYVINPNEIKESIIVKERQSSYEYNFVMDFDGLIPLLQQDGSVYLTETNKGNEPVFIIEAPYMFDADEAISTQVKMTIKQTGKYYALKLVADSEWINAPERKFPVTVDPTLKLDLSRSQILDTYVDNSGPNYNHTWDGFVYVGYNSLGLTRTLVV